MKKKNIQDQLIFSKYKTSLKRTLSIIERERFLNKNHRSPWTIEQLDCIEKEIKDLYEAAKKNIVDFPYDNARLKSTYLMTDTLSNLFNTSLGKEISSVQTLYKQLHKYKYGIFSFFSSW